MHVKTANRVGLMQRLIILQRHVKAQSDYAALPGLDEGMTVIIPLSSLLLSFMVEDVTYLISLSGSSFSILAP